MLSAAAVLATPAALSKRPCRCCLLGFQWLHRGLMRPMQCLPTAVRLQEHAGTVGGAPHQRLRLCMDDYHAMTLLRAGLQPGPLQRQLPDPRPVVQHRDLVDRHVRPGLRLLRASQQRVHLERRQRRGQDRVPGARRQRLSTRNPKRSQFLQARLGASPGALQAPSRVVLQRVFWARDE